MAVRILAGADQSDAWCKYLGNFPPAASSGMPISRAAWLVQDENVPGGIAISRPISRQRLSRALPLLVFLCGLLVAATVIWSPAALAQGMPGGGMGGGHGGRGGPPDGDRKGPPPGDAQMAQPPNPLRAMLGAMHKLRGDLLLTSTQIGPWSDMEDALRNCVEFNSDRVPPKNNANGVDAQLFVQDMADNERALSDAMSKLATTMKAALATLNPRQLKLTRQRLADVIDAELPRAR